MMFGLGPPFPRICDMLFPMKSWKEFLAVLFVCAVVVSLNLQATKSSETKGPSPAPNLTKSLGDPKYDLVLVQLDSDPQLVQWCQEEIEATTGVRVVRILRPTDSGESNPAFNPQRSQYEAEGLIGQLRDFKIEPSETVLAVTSKDLYLSSVPEWRYCFGTHAANRTAIISSVRMGARFQDSLFSNERAKDRFRKLLLRYVLEMAYQTPRNDNPSSLLYKSVLGPRDLDAMDYKI